MSAASPIVMINSLGGSPMHPFTSPDLGSFAETDNFKSSGLVLSDLPSDLLFQVFDFLIGSKDKRNLNCRVALVCKKFAAILLDERFWRLACIQMNVKVPLGRMNRSASCPAIAFEKGFASIHGNVPMSASAALEHQREHVDRMFDLALKSKNGGSAFEEYCNGEYELERCFEIKKRQMDHMYKNAFEEQRYHKRWSQDRVIDFLSARVYNLRNHEVGYTKLYYTRDYIILGFLREFHFYIYPQFEKPSHEEQGEMVSRYINQFPRRRPSIFANLLPSTSSSSDGTIISAADRVESSAAEELLLNHACTFQTRQDIVKLDTDCTEKGVFIAALTTHAVELFIMPDRVRNMKYQRSTAKTPYVNTDINPIISNAGSLVLEPYIADDIAMLHVKNEQVFILMKRGHEDDECGAKSAHIRIFSFATGKAVGCVEFPMSSKIEFTEAAWNARELFCFKDSDSLGAIVDQTGSQVFVMNTEKKEFATIESSKGVPAFVRTDKDRVLFWGNVGPAVDPQQQQQQEDERQACVFVELWQVKESSRDGKLKSENLIAVQYESLIAAHIEDSRIYILFKSNNNMTIYLDIWDAIDGSFVSRTRTLDDVSGFYDPRDFDKRYLRIMKADSGSLWSYVIQWKPQTGSILSVRQITTISSKSVNAMAGANKDKDWFATLLTRLVGKRKELLTGPNRSYFLPYRVDKRTNNVVISTDGF